MLHNKYGETTGVHHKITERIQKFHVSKIDSEPYNDTPALIALDREITIIRNQLHVFPSVYSFLTIPKYLNLSIETLFISKSTTLLKETRKA